MRRAGSYAVTVRVSGRRRAKAGTFRCGEVVCGFALEDGADEVTFAVELKVGEGAVRVVLEDDAGEYGAHQVELRRE